MKFVFDLDGTLCFKGQPIAASILAALKEVTATGHEVIFASARPIRDMLPVIASDFHHYSMIGGNGSLISVNGKVIQSTAFSEDEINQIKQWIHEHQATYLVDSEWDYAYSGAENHPIRQNVDPGKLAKECSLGELKPIVKVLFLTANQMDKLATKLEALNVYVNRHGQEGVLDISPKGVHKWSALQVLGVEKQAYIAFGNDANDQTMFKNARYAVQIGEYQPLTILANEQITLEGDFEQAIADKIRFLARSSDLF